MGEDEQARGLRRWARAARGVREDLRRATVAVEGQHRLAKRRLQVAERQLEVARQTKRATERMAEAARASARENRKQLTEMSKLLGQERALLRELKSEIATANQELRTLRISATEERSQRVHRFAADHQMTYRETLVALAQGEQSFARFGDGELRMMVDPYFRLGFQVNSAELREALRATLQDESDGLLLGWPRPFWTAQNASVWAIAWDSIEALLPRDRRFGNSHVSRPDCFQELGDEAVELWRRVWDGKRVVVVTGRGSRFDLVPQLFDNLAGHEVVHAEPRNAFSELDRVEAEVRACEGADLCLVALGPAGTVLAARLARAGVRTLDIGHLSSSYLNVFEGQPHPERTPPVRQVSADVEGP